MIDLEERLRIVQATAQYHDTLNPVAWDGLMLKSDVREALLNIATHFMARLTALPQAGVTISDIILTGSNANYNWTAYSDFDVHVVVDINPLQPERALLKGLFDLQRRLWGRTHQVTVKGYPVELYFQDANETHVSTGVFSLKNNVWLVTPVQQAPMYHHKDIEAKVREFRTLIGQAQDETDLRNAYEKIVQLRKTGLERAGEFSTENLVFKALRNDGHIEELIHKLQHLEDAKLSH